MYARSLRFRSDRRRWISAFASLSKSMAPPSQLTQDLIMGIGGLIAPVVRRRR